MGVDAGEHLKLIHRVINQMNLQSYLKDEAYSEGLVHITMAAQTFDPEKGPLASWLAKNIRWGLLNWLRQQRVENPLLPSVQGSAAVENGVIELNEAIGQAAKILTIFEYKILMYSALGFSGKRIATALGIKPVQVSRLKRKAQYKMTEFNSLSS